MRSVITLAYFSAALMSALAAFILLRRQRVPAGKWLLAMILAAGLWALCDAIELHLLTLPGKRLISAVQYFGIASTAPLFLRAALELAALRRPRGRWFDLLLWGIPAVTVALAWTSAWHGWLWRAIEIHPERPVTGIYYYGAWFWIFNAHAYALLAAATGMVIMATRQVTAPFRVPLWVVIVAVLIPWGGNAAYVYKLGPLPGLNWSSVAVVVTGCLLAWAVASRGLVDVLPRAREILVTSLRDGVVITDASGEVLFANETARALLWPGEAPAVLPAELLESCVNAAGGEASAAASRQCELPLTTAAGVQWLDLRVDPVRGRWNEVAGRLLVFRDSTARKALEAERQTLIEELQSALAEVRSLQGLLPICAGCRKLREEDGEWTQFEEYVSRHADVEFSHGLCPDCMQNLYGDYAAAAARLRRE